MSLRAKDHKNVRGAYKERQKALHKKDNRKRTDPDYPLPWKTSKGWGTRAGRERYPARNYGRAWEQRPRWFKRIEGEPQLESELDVDVDLECDEDEFDRQRICESPYDADVESTPLHVTEEESYELQLARALSLSLIPAEASLEDEEYDMELLQDIDGDTDGYSLMGTDAFSEVLEMEAYSDDDETHASDDTDWVDVDGDRICTESERPTYAQMTKVEVT